MKRLFVLILLVGLVACGGQKKEKKEMKIELSPKMSKKEINKEIKKYNDFFSLKPSKNKKGETKRINKR